MECIVVPPDIRGAASGDASASGDDSAAEALQDDFDSAEEPPVDAQWIQAVSTFCANDDEDPGSRMTEFGAEDDVACGKNWDAF